MYVPADIQDIYYNQLLTADRERGEKIKKVKKNNKGNRGFTLVEIMVIVSIIGLVVFIALPNVMRAREAAQMKVCIANLRHIDDAKALWAIDIGAVEGDAVQMTDLVPVYIRKTPGCPAGGTYDIGAIGEVPLCSISGHELVSESSE